MSVKAKIEAQLKYCKEHKLPYFAPKTGRCFKCHKQIYDKITMEKASSELITGCPYCNYSYCD